MTGLDLLRAHVESFNRGVRSGDFGPMIELFTGDAEMVFDGVPAGPYRRVQAIAPPTGPSHPTTRSTCGTRRNGTGRW